MPPAGSLLSAASARRGPGSAHPGCPGHPSVGEEELNRALGMYFAARLPGETPRPNRGESASAALHHGKNG